MSENTEIGEIAPETMVGIGGADSSVLHSSERKDIQVQRVSTMSSSVSDISAQTLPESATSIPPNLSIQTTGSSLTPLAQEYSDVPSPMSQAADHEEDHAPISPLSSSSSTFRSATIELVSISATSSAFPESFGLSISDQGRWIVAYSSAALYILLTDDLPYFSKRACRAFRLRRKPLAVAITDIGYFAVLTNSYKIDVYKCGDGSNSSSISSPIERIQTVVLANEAKVIALSPQGDMAAAGSEQGVEIIALGMEQGSSDRRQINCGPVLDWISFSDDSKSLLATGPAISTRTTPLSVLLSISGGFDQGFDMEEDEHQQQQPIPKLWISQLIFPEKLQAGQAAFLPDRSAGSAAANEEILAFNVKSERFGIFDSALKQFNGKVLGFPEGVAWDSLERYEDVLPGASSDGVNVAMAVTLKGEQKGAEIWTYEIESGWREEELSPLSAGSASGERAQSNLIANQRLQLPRVEDDSPAEFVSCLRWSYPKHEDDVSSSQDTKRLIALIHTAAVNLPEELAIENPAASAKVMLFNLSDSDSSDFERQTQNDENHYKAIINLDEFALTEDLAVEDLALEREVDIVRQRTQVQRNQRRPPGSTRNAPQPISGNNPPRRSVTSSVVRVNNGPRNLGLSPSSQGSLPLPDDLRRRRSNENTEDVSSTSSPLEPGSGTAVDEPYSNQAPRSQFTLQRAATVAQNSPAARMHLRALPDRPLEYRPANGRGSGQRQASDNLPSGVTAGPGDVDDGWVAPPPPYSERPDNVASLPIESIPGMADAVLRGQLLIGQQRQRQGEGARMRARVSRVVTVPIPVAIPTSAPEPTPAPVRNAIAPTPIPVPVPVPVPTSQTTGRSATVMRRPLASQAVERGATLQIPQMPQQLSQSSSSVGNSSRMFPSSAPVTPVDNLRRSRTSYGPSPNTSISNTNTPIDIMRPPIQPIEPNTIRQQHAQQLAEQHYADHINRRRQNGHTSANRTISPLDPLNRSLPPVPPQISIEPNSAIESPTNSNYMQRPVTESAALNSNIRDGSSRLPRHGTFDNRYGPHGTRSLTRLDTSLSAPNAVSTRDVMTAGTSPGRRQQWWRPSGSNNNSRSRSWSALDQHNDDDRYTNGQYATEEREKKCVIQ